MRIAAQSILQSWPLEDNLFSKCAPVSSCNCCSKQSLGKVHRVPYLAWGSKGWVATHPQSVSHFHRGKKHQKGGKQFLWPGAPLGWLHFECSSINMDSWGEPCCTLVLCTWSLQMYFKRTAQCQVDAHPVSLNVSEGLMKHFRLCLFRMTLAGFFEGHNCVSVSVSKLTKVSPLQRAKKSLSE